MSQKIKADRYVADTRRSGCRSLVWRFSHDDLNREFYTEAFSEDDNPKSIDVRLCMQLSKQQVKADHTGVGVPGSKGAVQLFPNLRQCLGSRESML
ncbi:MAG: hypothetical protein ACYDB9_05645 [Gammaproteobacteria bacterium]